MARRPARQVQQVLDCHTLLERDAHVLPVRHIAEGCHCVPLGFVATPHQLDEGWHPLGLHDLAVVRRLEGQTPQGHRGELLGICGPAAEEADERRHASRVDDHLLGDAFLLGQVSKHARRRFLRLWAV